MKTTVKALPARPVLHVLPSIIKATLEKHNVNAQFPTAYSPSDFRHQNNIYLAVAFWTNVVTTLAGQHSMYVNAYLVSNECKVVMYDPISRSKKFHPDNVFAGYIREAEAPAGAVLNYSYNDGIAKATYFEPSLLAALQDLASNPDFINHPEYKATLNFIFSGVRSVQEKKLAKKEKRSIQPQYVVEVPTAALPDFDKRVSMLKTSEAKIQMALSPQLRTGGVTEMNEASTGRLYDHLTNMDNDEKAIAFNGCYDVDISNSAAAALYHEAVTIDPSLIPKLSAVTDYIKNKTEIRTRIALEAQILPRMVKCCISSLAHNSTIPTSGQLDRDEREIQKLEQEAKEQNLEITKKSMYAVVNHCALTKEEMKMLGVKVSDPLYNRHAMAARLVSNPTYAKLKEAFTIIVDTICEYYKSEFATSARSWVIPNAVQKELIINLEKGQHFPKAKLIAHIYQGLERAKLNVFVATVPDIIATYHDGFTAVDKISEIILKDLVKKIYEETGEIIQIEQKQYPTL